jgi:lipoyl(octanoyl) transferase
VDPDLDAFARINPCGMAGLPVTSLRRLGIDWPVEEAGRRFAQRLEARLAAAA